MKIKRASCVRPAEAKNPSVERSLDLDRHRQACSICAHQDREEIERDFIAWKSVSTIVQEYRIGDPRKMYRHANAFGLYAKRQRNVRLALEKIIEKAGDVEVNASAVVAAIQAYSKINAQGQWVDRSEHVNLNELFERMSADELEAYSISGTLPDWFIKTTGIAQHAEEGIADAQPARNKAE
jgi:hypothetical protein